MINLPISDANQTWKSAFEISPLDAAALASITSGAGTSLNASVTNSWTPPAGYIGIGEGADATQSSHRFQLCVKIVDRTYTAYDGLDYDTKVFEFWVAKLNRSDYTLDSWINVSPDEPKLTSPGKFREAWAPTQTRSYQANAITAFSSLRGRCSDGLSTANQQAWVRSGDLQGLIHGALWLPGDRLMLRVSNANQIACWDLSTGTRLWIKESYSQLPADFVAIGPDLDRNNPPFGSGFSPPGNQQFSTTAWDVICQLSNDTVLVLEEKQDWLPEVLSDLLSRLSWTIEIPAWAQEHTASATADGNLFSKYVYRRIGEPTGSPDVTPAVNEDNGPWFGRRTSETSGGQLTGAPEGWDFGAGTGEAAPLPIVYTQFLSEADAQSVIATEMLVDFATVASVSKYLGHRCWNSTIIYREYNFLTGELVSSFSPNNIPDRGLQFEEPEKNVLGQAVLETSGWGTLSSLNLVPHPDSECYLLVDDGEGGLVSDRTPGDNPNLNGFWVFPDEQASGYVGKYSRASDDATPGYVDLIWHTLGKDEDPSDPFDRNAWILASNNAGSLQSLTDAQGRRLFPDGLWVFRNTNGVIEDPPYPDEDLRGAVSWFGARIKTPTWAGLREKRTLAKPTTHHSGKCVVFGSDRLIFLPRDLTTNFPWTDPGNVTPNNKPAVIAEHNKECRWSHEIVCYKRDSEDSTHWAVEWTLNTFDLWPDTTEDLVSQTRDQTVGDCPTNGFVGEDGRLYTTIKGADGYHAVRIPCVDVEGATKGTVEQSVALSGVNISPNRQEFKDSLIAAQRELLLCTTSGSSSQFRRLKIL